ncbi:MAG: hypothetical protein IIA72_23280 [Proteobacteria bacterium]|nr:hypothetical protein [Pseudomonadota bacterium]
MTTADNPPLETHAFEQDGFQAARLGPGDQRAIGDSDPGRLWLACCEIEDDEVFFRVASDLQFGLERNNFLLLSDYRKLEEGVACHYRGRDYLGARPRLGVRVEANFVKPGVSLSVVPRKHELHFGDDDAVAVPFRPKLNGDRIAQVLGLGLAPGIVQKTLKVIALQYARRRPAGFIAWSQSDS